MNRMEGVMAEEDFEVKACSAGQKKKEVIRRLRKAMQSGKRKANGREWNFQAIIVE